MSGHLAKRWLSGRLAFALAAVIVVLVALYPPLGRGSASAATRRRLTSLTPPLAADGGAHLVRGPLGGLWVSDLHSDTVTVFRSPPASSPFVRLSRGITHPEALAFDNHGDLWVGDAGQHPSILEFTARAVARRSGPVITIPTRGLSPEGLAFDPRGDLWVAGGGAVIEIAATSLGHASSPVRVITTPPLLDGPDAVAFSGQGNLWVANYNNRVLLEFPVQGLRASRPEAKLHIQLPGGAAPFAVAFDGHGDLWVTCQNDMVYEFGARNLGATNTPIGRIDMSMFISGGATGLAFDPRGNLWVSAVGSSGSGSPEGMVYEFGARNLGATNTPIAHLVASTSANPGTWALAFFPVR